MQLSKYSPVGNLGSLQLRISTAATYQNATNWYVEILTASQEKLYEVDEKELEGLHFYNFYLAVKGERIHCWHNNDFANWDEELQNSEDNMVYMMHDTLKHIHKTQPSESEQKAPAYGPGKAVEQTSTVQ